MRSSVGLCFFLVQTKCHSILRAWSLTSFDSELELQLHVNLADRLMSASAVEKATTGKKLEDELGELEYAGAFTRE